MKPTMLASRARERSATWPLGAALLSAVCGAPGCGQAITETETLPEQEGVCPDTPLDLAFGDADSHFFIEGLSVAVDSACNLLVAGMAQGEIKLGGADLGLAEHPYTFVAKLDPNGGHLWSLGLENVRLHGKHVIAVDSQDAILVGGVIVDLGPEGDDADEVTLFKLDADGNQVWGNGMLGNAPADVGFQGGFRRHVTGVAVGPDDSVVIGGDFIGETDFGGVTLTSVPVEMPPGPTDYKPDAFVAGYDAGGKLLFARSFGGDNYDRDLGLDTTPSGDIVVAYSHSPGFYLPDDVYGMYHMKLAPDGTTVWSTFAGESGIVYNGTSVAATDAGGMVVGGNGLMDFGALCSCAPAFAARLDANGEYELAQPLGDPSAAETEPTVVLSVAPDGTGGILAVGGFTKTLLIHGKAVAESSGGTDGFEAHIEESLDAITATATGGAADELTVALARTPDGDRVVAGVEGPLFKEQGESSLWTGGARLFLRRRPL